VRHGASKDMVICHMFNVEHLTLSPSKYPLCILNTLHLHQLIYVHARIITYIVIRGESHDSWN